MHMHGGRLSAFTGVHLLWRSAHHPTHQFRSWKACGSLPSVVNVNSLRPLMGCHLARGLELLAQTCC